MKKNTMKREAKKALKYRLRHLQAEDLADVYVHEGSVNGNIEKFVTGCAWGAFSPETPDITCLLSAKLSIEPSELDEEQVIKVLDRMIDELRCDPIMVSYQERTELEKHLAEIGEMPDVTHSVEMVYWHEMHYVPEDRWEIRGFKFLEVNGGPGGISVRTPQGNSHELWLQGEPVANWFRVTSGWLKEHDSFDGCMFLNPMPKGTEHLKWSLERLCEMREALR